MIVRAHELYHNSDVLEVYRYFPLALRSDLHVPGNLFQESRRLPEIRRMNRDVGGSAQWSAKKRRRDDVHLRSFERLYGESRAACRSNTRLEYAFVPSYPEEL